MSYVYTNNRLTQRTPATEDPFTYGYDNSGNQRTETAGTPAETTTNDYDSASHPARTTNPDGSWAAYTYDGLGRMATRKDSTGETTLFFHFGLKDQIAIEETSGTPRPETRRYLINSFGSPLGQQKQAGPCRNIDQLLRARPPRQPIAAARPRHHGQGHLRLRPLWQGEGGPD